MYRKILVAVENGPADKSLVPHATELAKQLGAELLLVHVADGFAARHYKDLKLAESEEMIQDRAYLQKVAEQVQGQGVKANVQLALGNPPDEILKCAEQAHCDLIAMASHGHRLIGDLLFGSTIHEVRHQTSIPVLIVRAGQPGPTQS